MLSDLRLHKITGNIKELLDHLYTMNPQYIFQDSVYNKNILGYDHHYVAYSAVQCLPSVTNLQQKSHTRFATFRSSSRKA